MTYTVEPVGIIHTCFPEKFGIPRQPLLAPSAKGVLVLHAPYNHPDCVVGLEKVSHLWLSFIFHKHVDKGWKPKVRPPRLGGNEKMGVFATRSSFRPNHLGLSVVKLDEVVIENQEVCLHLSGIDLVDGTPIVDIKPYVPYADSVVAAHNDFAGQTPLLMPVNFSEQAQLFCQQYEMKKDRALLPLVVEVLQQDPKPAYHSTAHSTANIDREYGVALWDCNVRWHYVSVVDELGVSHESVYVRTIDKT
jgi:tRNA-Thr(GGU) m(6)t(6)A37 methyltransferase TsaA